MADEIVYTLLENNPEFNTQGGSDTNKKKLNRSRFDKGAIRIAGHFVPTKPKGYIADSDYIRDCYTGKPLSDTIEEVQEAAVASQEQLNSMLEDGKIKSDYLPSYVDDVVEYPTFADFPEEGEEGKIYIDLETGNSYRWSGSEYFPFSEGSLRVVFSMSYPYTTVSDCSATHAEIKAAVDDGKFVYGYSERYGSLVLKSCDTVRATFGTFEHSTQNGGFLTIIQIDISDSDTYDVSFAYAPTYTYINLSRIDKLTVSEFNTLVTNQTLHAGNFYVITDDGNKLYYATAYNAYKELTNSSTDVFVIRIQSGAFDCDYSDLVAAIDGGKQIVVYLNTILYSLIYIYKQTDSMCEALVCTGATTNPLGYPFIQTNKLTFMSNGTVTQYSSNISGFSVVSDTDGIPSATVYNNEAAIQTLLTGNTLKKGYFYYATDTDKLLLATSSNTLIEITTTSYTPQP